MTTFQPALTNELFRTGKDYALKGHNPAARPAPVFNLEFSAPRALPLANTSSLNSVIDDFKAKSPEFVEHLKQARRKLVDTIYSEEKETSLSALRLKAGLSQAELAEKINTSQSYIARIENGITDPGTALVVKLAQAINTSEAAVLSAIIYQRKIRGL